jgi:hypothetical protein
MRRYDLLNWLVQQHGYTRYLEIGIDNPSQCFHRVLVANKTGVDPRVGQTVPPVHYRMTSDAFFKINKERFDLVFIDGLHVHQQVVRDVTNALAVLNEGGTIVMHDCMPYSAVVAGPEPVPGKSWYGTVWAGWVELRRTRPDLYMRVVPEDCGLGMVRRGSQEPLALDIQTWEQWAEHQTEIALPMSEAEMETCYGRRP